MDGLDFLFDDDKARPRVCTHPASLTPETLMQQCRLTRGRTSGPGGQHRNKTQTMVELCHEPTGICAYAAERRSPEVNRKVALRRLRLALAVEHRCAVPDGEARTAMWMRRVKNRRIVCSVRHQDFPAMLAQAMDVVYACDLDVKRASVRLACSMSQLVRFIARHPPALDRLNADRRTRGMRALHP